MKKKWYKSKTVWFNVATVVAAMLTTLGTMLPTLALVVSPAVMPYVMIGVALINVGLRFVTDQGVE